MGLDMYAYKVRAECAGKDVVDFKLTDELIEAGDAQEFHYWRKHPDLHRWMEKLYRGKGGKKEFNCTTVRLFETDIDRLEKAVGEQKLPRNKGGFFFGASSYPEDLDSDREFITKARKALQEGCAVFYYSWW